MVLCKSPTLVTTMPLIRVVEKMVFRPIKNKTPEMTPVVVLVEGIMYVTVTTLVMTVTVTQFVTAKTTPFGTATLLLFMKTKKNLVIE
ncbi:hypothetical protein PR003_g10066 [Phytophthora rubi]|uniref:Uncharacterized protein n=1 Tax=Phytophthora rubi TaxID=129364 RepID=A0A6A4FF32_9STRA|nr:hypothetical protein PR002_g11309 [Phytophthora rubi]KAE9341287.1 hypothetical protein PR003_g10066 [Phytophthora rubi]